MKIVDLLVRTVDREYHEFENVQVVHDHDGFSVILLDEEGNTQEIKFYGQNVLYASAILKSEGNVH